MSSRAKSVTPTRASRSIRSITMPAGFRAAGGTCRIKPSGQPDLALIVADEPCYAAGVFTKSKITGAAVEVSRRHVRNGRAQAIICNSGISNVGMGDQGINDAQTMCGYVAERVGCAPADVLVCSTGVIGVPLPVKKIEKGIGTLARRLARGNETDQAVARAILTTDTVIKSTHRQIHAGSYKIALGGVAKGSGMIAPDMATMLCFITTDAAIESRLLAQALRQAVKTSFNRISIDSDTSTSDSVLVLASGAAMSRAIRMKDRKWHAFTDALTDLCEQLSYELVSDGEGATRVFRVIVEGARSERDADRVGKAVVESPLVKTAVHGRDSNWGRLLMAIGKSGAAFNERKLSITIGDQAVMQGGTPVPSTAVRRRGLKRLMGKSEVVFTIDLGAGQAACEWLGCDLSREYVTINADYTT